MPIIPIGGGAGVGQAPIVLSTGAIARYPLASKFKYATQTVSFADFSRQTFSQLATPLGSWEIDMSLLQDSEMSDWYQFWRNYLGAAAPFIFIDPADNLLQYSEKQESSPWTVSLGTVASAAVADPFGIVSGRVRQVNFSTASGSANLQQILGIAPGGSGNSRTKGITVTLSLYLQAVGGGPTTIELFINDSGGSENVTKLVTVSSTWTRFSVTKQFSASNPQSSITCGLFSPNVIGPLNVFGAQLEIGGTASPYKLSDNYCGLHPKCYFANDEFDRAITEFNINQIKLSIEESN